MCKKCEKAWNKMMMNSCYPPKFNNDFCLYDENIANDVTKTGKDVIGLTNHLLLGDDVVLTENGVKKVEELKVGDELLQGCCGKCKITNILKSEDRPNAPIIGYLNPDGTSFKTYTDYPLEELGDELYREALVRECIITDWDGDIYVDVLICGTDVEASFKRFYVYTEEGRLDDVPSITTDILANMFIAKDSNCNDVIGRTFAVECVFDENANGIKKGEKYIALPVENYGNFYKIVNDCGYVENYPAEYFKQI